MELITFPLTKKRLRNMLSGDCQMHLFGFQREPFTVYDDEAFSIGK